jgi:hypothetical protein
MLYSDEVWTGIEYQVASHMIYEGLVAEAFAIVKGARDRYDGVPRPPIGRNPWCEIECGGHYTRAMSSWSLLLALSGYHYDPLVSQLRFAPAYQTGQCKCFFTSPAAWGSLKQTAGPGAQTAEISIKRGTLPVKNIQLTLANNAPFATATVTVGEMARPARSRITGRTVEVEFELLVLKQGNEMKVTLS